MKLNLFLRQFFIFLFFLLSSAKFQDYSDVEAEGMYPLSELKNLNLNKAGLEISVDEIYNPSKTSIVEAIVRIGGCTGSFISENGLILTNHHCVFGEVANISDAENNYLENGFVAKSYEEEFPAAGLTARIVQSYEDVSEFILNQINDVKDFAQRNKKIQEIKKELEKKAVAEDKNIVAEVAEMFVGKTYVLFKYRIIRDIRLVYVPPRNIGEFGGETDNWIWPRHTGDFAIVRAYVDSLGNAADFDKKNVPYKPKSFLKINSKGVKEGDFVFMLGFPGRTFRHYPAKYYEYQYNYLLPYVQQLYAWQINLMNQLSEGNVNLQLKFAGKIKSLANVEKNYRGKMLGLKRTNLIEQRKKQEKELFDFIKNEKELSQLYGNLEENLNKIYDEIIETAPRDLWFSQLYRTSSLIKAFDLLANYTVEIRKPENERKEQFISRKISSVKNNISSIYNKFDLNFEKKLLVKMIIDAGKFSEKYRIEYLDKNLKKNYSLANVEKFVERLLEKTKFLDKSYIDEFFEMKPEKAAKIKDPMLEFALELSNIYDKITKDSERINGALEVYLAQFVDAKMKLQFSKFTPDANRTLRFTYGYVKGYNPADALYARPKTSLSGMIDKSNREEDDYKINSKIVELYNNKDYGEFVDPEINDMPVCMLYDMDTTGGNSGSPVMNSKGELVGLNFDRTFEATINDYAWSESYSRSIGLDIRFVLWTISKVSNAERVYNELINN
jgi:hypothetical protein